MTRRAIALLAILTCLALHDASRFGPVPLGACAPPPPYPFGQPIVPDAAQYAQGQLGIVLPFFARRYLVVAWRYVNGIPLTTYEQAALTAAPPSSSVYGAESESEAVQRWLTARRAIVPSNSTPGDIRRWKAAPGDAYSYYFNCPDDAFATAADTLALLIEQYGATSRFTTDWVTAQDAVFSRCGGDAASTPALAELPDDAPPLARRERAYQIAAAAFYAGNWDAAEHGFRAVAADRTSRWQPWGRYLAARTQVRRATLAPGSSAPSDPALLSAAETELRAVVAESSDDSVRGAAERMLRYVELRTRPEAMAVSTAERLRRPRDAGAVAADFDEFRFLLNAKIKAADPAVREVLEAAGRVPASSPAFATIAFHRARVLIEDGRSGAARAVLDPLLETSATWPASTVNLFRAARLRTARSLPEFLADAARVRVASADVPPEAPTSGFDADSADVINQRMPLSMLAAAAAARELPGHLRRDVAIAAFTRALLLGADDRLPALAQQLAASAPELARPLRRVIDAPSPASRRAEAWVLVLRHPGLRPFVPRDVMPRGRLHALDRLRDHWWCAFSTAAPAAPPGAATDPASEPSVASYEAEWARHSRDARFLRLLYPAPGRPASPEVLTPADREQARGELEALARLGPAATILAQQAVAFARAYPSDPHAPEALYLGVRATRYGCTDDATGKASKAAFDLLHRRYPQSEWAKRTPYWYR